MCVGWYKRSSFPCNSWFDEECNIYLKLYKFAKGESEQVMAWHQYKKKRLFKLQPSLAWKQLRGKKEDIKCEFTNEEMIENVQSLYMHEGVALWLRTFKHLVIHALILKMSVREQRRWLRESNRCNCHYKWALKMNNTKQSSLDHDHHRSSY